MQSLLEEIEFRNPTRARGDAETLAALPVPVAQQIGRLLESLPDPDEALHFFGRFRREAPQAFEEACQSPTALHYLLHVFSYSAFLSEAVIRHPGWLLELADSPDMHRVFTVEEYERRLAGFRSAQEFAGFRRRQLLRIVLRDVLRLAELSHITEELSNLADAILGAAWRQVRAEIAPLLDDAQFSVLSMGKLGGRELNYSSDVDLMFVYTGAHRELFQRAAAAFTEMLSTYTAEGLCYRVDLRLRPDGRYGEICQSLAGAKRYYENRARDWELQMLIKARVSAGDPEPGRELLMFVDPLIYSSTLDFQATESVSEARERIHDKLLQRSERAGLDVKLAPGGIRDVEFLVQCLQRLHGAREPWVRHGGTRMALFRLRGKELLSDPEYRRLDSAYEFLRHLEHRLQIQEDRQTHTLPSDMEALDLLARKMPAAPGAWAANAGTLERELDDRLNAVREIYDRVVHRLARPAGGGSAAAVAGRVHDDARVEIFREKLASEPKWLNCFEGNAEVRACILDLFEHSNFFGDQFIRHPALIEQVEIACGARQGREGFAPPDDPSGLRRFFREQMVRIQSDSVCHRAPIFKTLKRTSALADAVIASAYRIAVAGTAPAMMVIALGRLGMREFDLASDADLVFVLPDSHAEEMQLWTGIAERIIQAIGVYTGDGVLFSVDTRLRPNGRAGALVQTESAFKEYFALHAEAWEGISYMKARGVAGDAERTTGFLQELQQVDWRRYGQSGRSRKELAGMRARLEKEQGARNALKAGAGGYYDIDFALLYYRLKGAGMFYKTLNTPERIDIVEKMGHLEREDAEFLREAATFYRALDHGLRISIGHAEGRLPVAPEPLAKLTELVRRWDHVAQAPVGLEERLNMIRQRTRVFFDRVFG
jgi:glutamate-ammonia-ligase adenylyltransferase